MESTSNWPWARCLALVELQRPVQIERILFEAARERCASLGVREGTVVTCTNRNDRDMTLELPGGSSVGLAREVAWFLSWRDIDRGRKAERRSFPIMRPTTQRTSSPVPSRAELDRYAGPVLPRRPAPSWARR